MARRTTLAALAADASATGWMNVYVRFADRPVRVTERGGRWQVSVRDLAGDATAFVCVHDRPDLAGLGLPYPNTAPRLLELFADRALNYLFDVGETALVQAYAARSRGLLYLNVPAVLLVRPFRRFGRQQIDLASGCARKSYLAVAKGVGRRRDPGHAGGVGGELAHAVFARVAAAAGRGEEVRGREAEFTASGLEPELLADVVQLGLSDPADVDRVLRPAGQTYRLALETPGLLGLLQADEWHAESNQLDNGVSVTPDLLGTRNVVELKTVAPGGVNDRPRSADDQVRGYLAWAMVEFGAADVLARMSGWVVHLHPDVRPVDRIREIRPELSQLGWRVWTRHRLIALTSGAWLPAPDRASCNECEYSDPEPSPIGERLPAACQFYCQNERHWDCHGPDPEAPTTDRVCPLIERCDQYARFDDPARLDRFNRARLDLLDEEEQLSALAEVGEAARAGELAALAGLAAGPFAVAAYTPPLLHLGTGGEWRVLRFASPGMAFRLLTADGRDLGRAVFRRDQADTLEFRFGTAAVRPGEQVWLGNTLGDPHPVREQLRFLDRLERSGREPLGIGRTRSGGTTCLTVRAESLAKVPATARVVLVDARGTAGVAAATEDAVRRTPGNLLLVAPAGWPLPQLAELADLDPDALADRWAGLTGAVRDRLLALVGATKAARVWAVPVGRVIDGALDRYLGSAHFDAVVVAAAQELPLVAVDRCLELGRRLILIGDAAAGGPRAESPRARQSILFQNTLRVLLDAGSHLLPSAIAEIAVVRLRYPRAVPGLEAITGLPDPSAAIPIHSHSVEGRPVFDGLPAAELAVEVPASGSVGFARTLELSVEAGLSLRQLRLIIRSLTAGPVEACATAEGKTDERLLGCSVRVVRNDTRNQPAGGGVPHRVHVLVSAVALPTWLERCGRNAEECASLLDYAAANPDRSFVATSPFFAQSVGLARLASERGLTNVVVRSLDTVGRSENPAAELLVSLVAGAPAPAFPFPLNEPGRLLDLFSGRFRAVRLFGSPELLSTHPLIHRLVECSN